MNFSEENENNFDKFFIFLWKLSVEEEEETEKTKKELCNDNNNGYVIEEKEKFNLKIFLSTFVHSNNENLVFQFFQNLANGHWPLKKKLLKQKLP